jgi:hypothetical protein
MNGAGGGEREISWSSLVAMQDHQREVDPLAAVSCAMRSAQPNFRTVCGARSGYNEEAAQLRCARGANLVCWRVNVGGWGWHAYQIKGVSR